MVMCSLFIKYPEVMSMFPLILQEFPEGKITDREKFRSSEIIQRHSSAVLSFLDQMITAIDNPIELRQLISLCVQKHERLRPRGLKGEHFGVCITLIPPYYY